ncbi:hypothetical protein Vafri_14251, partial [Volvox africanus]
GGLFGSSNSVRCCGCCTSLHERLQPAEAHVGRREVVVIRRHHPGRVPQNTLSRTPALKRRFRQVYVDQPTVAPMVTILRGLHERYEVHHGVLIRNVMTDCMMMHGHCRQL